MVKPCANLKSQSCSYHIYIQSCTQQQHETVSITNSSVKRKAMAITTTKQTLKSKTFINTKKLSAQHKNTNVSVKTISLLKQL